ncbi:MAG: hypothetical protein K8I29_15630 [Alphaproteobacteria bacterium]|uniref:Polymerase nucleotidyl transferase domain-containing protein n=1 Tax=Candidatus Nitrobium versatile TaxID=2884831 RepID=A0A953J8D0_9BACT|nr:hypothetical protein [Candidatus Nitrobium versatile]
MAEMQTEIRIDDRLPAAVQRIGSLFHEILKEYPRGIHSLHLIGSAITPDFNPKTSDINSLVVLHDMDFGFIRFLASHGKRYKKMGIAAPLIMTPAYIRSSLDVFPIEFHDMRRIHRTVYGDDILADLQIDRQHLRIQCEREIKTKLVALRQGYVSTLDDKNLLLEGLSRSITGYIPLFRAIIALMGKEPPVPKQEVIETLCALTDIGTDVFRRVLLLKNREIKFSKEEAVSAFEQYYRATERIGALVDELRIA